MKKYKCTCGLPIDKVYEVCSAIWKKEVTNEEDQGEIVHYGDSYYNWECSDKVCCQGMEAHDMPEEWGGDE